MNKRWVGAFGRRCSGERGVHQTGIKPTMVQTICWHWRNHVAGCFASYGTTPAWLPGFRLLGRCIGQMSYREVSVFGPVRSPVIFGLTPAFRRRRPVAC